MKNKFKEGDLVFEVSFLNGIKLIEITNNDDPIYTIKGNGDIYTENGKKFALDTGCVPSLLLATPEMRENLVAIWGEDAVPKLPLRGSELTKKLLEKQKYALCYVSDTSDDDARAKETAMAIVSYNGWFLAPSGCGFGFAVPVDMNGNEITEIEE